MLPGERSIFLDRAGQIASEKIEIAQQGINLGHVGHGFLGIYENLRGIRVLPFNL